MADDRERLDYRFTLANERTLLAWLRTALALMAGAVAVTQLVPALEGSPWATALGVALAAAAVGVTLLAHRRWQRAEAAMHAGTELPASRLPAVLAGVLVVVGLAVALLVVLA